MTGSLGRSHNFQLILSLFHKLGKNYKKPRRENVWEGSWRWSIYRNVFMLAAGKVHPPTHLMLYPLPRAHSWERWKAARSQSLTTQTSALLKPSSCYGPGSGIPLRILSTFCLLLQVRSQRDRAKCMMKWCWTQPWAASLLGWALLFSHSFWAKPCHPHVYLSLADHWPHAMAGLWPCPNSWLLSLCLDRLGFTPSPWISEDAEKILSTSFCFNLSTDFSKECH